MPNICWYFQLHQPYRLANFEVFDIGHERSYFEHPENDLNRDIFHKVTQKSYLPMLRLLLQLTQEVSQFKCSISASGVFIEQAERYAPEVLQLLKALAETGQVEFLSETYYHSLSYLYSSAEFVAQVREHQALIKSLFDQKTKVFRNTELIYDNTVAQYVASMGFTGMLTEAVGRYLHGRSKTQPFQSTSKPALPLLLKHAELSDDIAFRFSDKNWKWHPLSVEQYLEWLEVYGETEYVNLFMDFETFGEHQWADTGIFEFFAALIKRLDQRSWNHFVTPSEVLEPLYMLGKQGKSQLPVYDVRQPISWADVDRDLTAWVDNPLQQDCLRQIYALEKHVLKTEDQKLLKNWRELQTSDHFYYMCTKWSADGDVHAYFSPYDSPYEAYRRFSIVIADMKERLLGTTIDPYTQYSRQGKQTRKRDKNHH